MVTITEFIILAGSLGTAGLAIAAFINISKPLRPKIKISYGVTGEYLSEDDNKQCSSPNSLGERCNYLVYRIKVENSKKVTSSYAKRVYLRFMAVSKIVDDDKLDELQPFNPFTMRWTSLTDNDNAFYNDLAKGEYLYANFFTIKCALSSSNYNTIDKLEILLGHEGIKDIALPAGFPRKALEGNGKFRFKIGVFAENMKGKEFNYEVAFEVGPDMDQKKVNISEL